MAPMPKAMALALSFFFLFDSQGQIIYDWEGSKEGWVPASEANLGCNLIEQPEAMAMRAFNTTPVMRSGTLSENLGIDASDYDRIQITLKNPTSSGNPNARLFTLLNQMLLCAIGMCQSILQWQNFKPTPGFDNFPKQRQRNI